MVLDGAGKRLTCEVVAADRKSVQLRVTGEELVERPPFEITLVQALAKGKAFDNILQKATELGAHRIVPLLTERAVPHLDQENVEKKLSRWQSTMIEALKQCSSPRLPEIVAPQTPKDWLRQAGGFDLSLIASLDTAALHPRICLKEFREQHGRWPGEVAVWIGPEGDFTPGEIDLARQSEVRPITLGPLVLRSDTAAIYCLSFLNYELRARD